MYIHYYISLYLQDQEEGEKTVSYNLYKKLLSTDCSVSKTGLISAPPAAAAPELKTQEGYMSQERYPTYVRTMTAQCPPNISR